MILRNAIRNEQQVLTLTDSTGWFDILSSEPEAIKVHNALQVSPIAAAHRILTNSIGHLPIKIFQKAGGSRKEVDHYLDSLLSIRPNINMSPFVFKKHLMSQAFWHGDGFAYIDRISSGRAKAFIPLPSDTMQAYVDPDGRVWYAFSVNGAIRKFEQSELIHVMFDTTDGLTGRGMLAIAKETIANERYAQKYEGKFYRNGGRLSGVIEVASKLDRDKKDKVRDSFERMASGMDNAFRVAVMDLGMKYTPLGVTQKDAQFVESRNFSIDEVSRYTGVPQYKLQSGKQAYSSNEQQGLDYVTGTLQPHVVQWEQEFQYKLLRDSELAAGMYMRFNLAAEMRGDNESRARFYQLMLSNCIYSPNDVLALEERNSIPGGDVHFVTKNYTTLERMLSGEEEGDDV